MLSEPTEKSNVESKRIVLLKLSETNNTTESLQKFSVKNVNKHVKKYDEHSQNWMLG